MKNDAPLIGRRVSRIAQGALAAAAGLLIALLLGWVPVELAVMLRSHSSGGGSPDDTPEDPSPPPDRV
jgi:hypothetical protein